MSDQKVIYSTLRFLQSPSESQNRIRPGRTQRPGKTDDKEFSVPWHLIAVILGILCLLLSVTVAVLGTKIFQYIQENHQQRENIRNLSQEYRIVQNDSYFKEQLLTNKILECNSRENESLQQKMKQDFIERTCQRKNIGKLYESHWSCCGIKCYYFIPEYKNWKGCKQTCQSYNSFLLKINDQDELTFIQTQTYRNYYWIGLSYNRGERKWKWIDSDPLLGMHYAFMNISGRGQCAFLSSTRITNAECSQMYNCICEKTIGDIFFPCFNNYKKR
ncbi:killer cell lectin-like receptor 2 [Herpailurus yagouaroundi]|uniref:killer cell lectin-like receptor 2 n=1 Tax=Herpailurus yagouaroundi TaxID=1608482 RepID=UPI001AD73A15|nr:killer cell lectin-like receptor 2 [Puma yagouaroundi]XP_040344864.1 killer cell lectin-like receptor 2 [Puma yagouaroundi]